MEIVAETSSASVASEKEPSTVLIVDDDYAVAESLADFLQDEGFDVVIATDGRLALDKLRCGLRPCAILLDLMMPRMNGWQFRDEQLRDLELKDIPTIIVSALPCDAAKRAQLGGVDFLPKPPLLPHLLAAIRRHCDEPLQ